MFRFTGIVIVSIATEKADAKSLFSSDSLTTGVLWSVLGAFCYALYLVFFKKAVGDERRIDIPMFFGKLYLILLNQQFLFENRYVNSLISFSYTLQFSFACAS